MRALGLACAFGKAACTACMGNVYARPTVIIYGRSLVDTSVVGTRSARELAALGPGTMLCDGNAYIFTFLAAASAASTPTLHSFAPLFATLSD